MRNHALKVHRADLGKCVPEKEYLVDIVGTGGDGWGTFNASTSAAIIAAGAGCYICKVQRHSLLCIYEFLLMCSMGIRLQRRQLGQQIY